MPFRRVNTSDSLTSVPTVVRGESIMQDLISELRPAMSNSPKGGLKRLQAYCVSDDAAPLMQLAWGDMMARGRLFAMWVRLGEDPLLVEDELINEMEAIVTHDLICFRLLFICLHYV